MIGGLYLAYLFQEYYLSNRFTDTDLIGILEAPDIDLLDIINMFRRILNGCCCPAIMLML